MHHVLDSVDRNLIFNAKQTILPPWQKVSLTLGLPRNIQNAIFKTVTMTNHRTEVHFSIFFSGGFITAIVVNPPERKLAKHTSVQWGVSKVPIL